MNNENVIVKQKDNKVVIILLLIIILGLAGFIMYDKYSSNKAPDKENKEAEVKEEVKDITNSSLASTLENSVKTSDNTRGLYYKNKITATDYNNPYLIMFGIKKYLLGNNITNIRSKLAGVEISDETTYKISKKTISEYMNKIFNTSGFYDLPLTTSMDDTYYFEDIVEFASLENEWGLVSVAKGGGIDYVHSELLKAEQIGDYVYIYDKMIEIGSGSDMYGVSYTLDNTYNDEYQCFSVDYGEQRDYPLCPVTINESNSDNYNELLSSELFKQLNDKLNTFKHTFKKSSDGNYYWVSSEVVNN